MATDDTLRRLATAVAVDATPATGPQLPFAVPRARPDRGLRAGRGHAVGHHGEILQGVFEQPDGTLVRALVSLVTPLFHAHATFRPSGSPLSVVPAWKTKAHLAAELVLETFGLPKCGQLTLGGGMRPRWGFGSSTSDVVATARAIAKAAGRSLTAEAIAGIAVRAETACDSTMFGGRAVLFAQRRGCVIEDLGGCLPHVHVIGFNTDPTGWGVDTLAFPPARYNWWEIEAFRPMLGLMRQAVQRQDARALGQVASASARINQRHLATRGFDRLEAIVERCGGLGLQVAHSGSVAGLLLPDDDLLVERRAAMERALEEIGIGSRWHFSTSGTSVEW